MKLFPGLMLWLILAPAIADEEWRHGLSHYGDLKYPPGFHPFDYVNPDAPKGGHLSQAMIGTFNNLHPYIDKGRVAVCVNIACMLPYDMLLKPSDDELASSYAMVAEAVRLDDEFRWVEFRLDPRARFHDGEPIKFEDVKYTFDKIKTEAALGWRVTYKDIVALEQTGPRSFKFHFSESAPKTPQLARHISMFWVMPKHYWESREFHATTLDIPLGHGPYRIKEVLPGKKIVFERVKDYWAADLPVNRGYYNIDTIEYVYYMDKNVVIEAHKAGEFDFRYESDAKAWMTMYDFEGLEQGLFVKDAREVKSPSGIAWGLAFNTRLAKLSDPRVREALTLAYDFDFSNRVLHYNQYDRVLSYFQGSDMAAGDTLPDEAELVLLEPFRDVIPERVFTQPFSLPVNDTLGRNREALAQADKLLNEAGWVVKDFKRVNEATGEPFTLSFLLGSVNEERNVMPYADNLARLGIETRVRTVERSQHRFRVRHHDFEVMGLNYGAQAIPMGWLLRSRFHGSNAAPFNTENYPGFNNPAIDFLVEKIIAAESEEEMNTAGRALDRVLLWGFYVIPSGYPAAQRLVYWDRFDDPNKVKTRTGYHDMWWVDPVKSLAVDKYLGRIKRSSLANR
ncbi:MAG: ABC transporter substrate-binding protein [Pseudomonadales bacterium]|nr:ABC transporter substrate-binding protein [Pseudomonadales bacterium]